MDDLTKPETVAAATSAGYSLNEAWIIFAAKEDRGFLDLASTRDDPQSRAAVERARAELLQKLRAHELIAVGVTHFELNAPRWRIVRPEICLIRNVRWDVGEVFDGGQRLSRVKVARLAPEIRSPDPAPNSNPRVKRSTIGRPMGVDKVAAIVQELRDRADQPFAGKLKKERWAMVAQIARERHSDLFVSDRNPSRSTLIAAFKTIDSG